MNRERRAPKFALVTSASKGTGSETPPRGAKVLAADVLDEQGSALAHRLPGESLGIGYRPLHASSPEQWQCAIGDIDESCAAVSVLVSNAEVTSSASVLDCLLEHWDQLVLIDQTGIFLGPQSVVPGVVEAGGVRRPASSGPAAHRDGTPNGFIAHVTRTPAGTGLTRHDAMNLPTHRVRVKSISPVPEGRPRRRKRARAPARCPALGTIPIGRIPWNSELSPDLSLNRRGQAHLHHGRRISDRRRLQPDVPPNVRSRTKKSSFIEEPDATQ